MNIFQFSISTIVFGSTLLLGTTAVIASRFVITTLADFTRPAAVSETVRVPAAEPERGVELPDLRHEPPPAPEDFDRTGTYALEFEKVPKAFADIDFIEITTRQYEQNGETFINRPIIPTGSLQTKESLALIKISVGNREISFESVQKHGISYQFVGTFFVPNEYIECEGCEYPGDLYGKLKKLKDGKVIAEMDAKFYMEGC